jgi:protein-S-isoprenylcysteine O-methyltransferase Ste14
MLHTGGLFSRMRNPGLVGLYIFIFGIWISIPSIYFLLGILFYIGYMHFKVLMEEDFLTNRYGSSYNEYISKTRRYY